MLSILTFVTHLFGMDAMAATANSDTPPKATHVPTAIKSTWILKPLNKDQRI